MDSQGHNREGERDAIPQAVTIIECKGANNVTVQLSDGTQVVAVLDTLALRTKYGPIYDIKIGGDAMVVLSSPPRIVDITQDK